MSKSNAAGASVRCFSVLSPSLRFSVLLTVTSAAPPRALPFESGSRREHLAVTHNSRKKIFEVRTSTRMLVFPFFKADPMPTNQDPVTDLSVDPEAVRDAFTYVLRSGRTGTVNVEQVLECNQDPSCLRNLLLYRLTLEAQKRIADSPLSKKQRGRHRRFSGTVRTRHNDYDWRDLIIDFGPTTSTILARKQAGGKAGRWRTKPLSRRPVGAARASTPTRVPLGPRGWRERSSDPATSVMLSWTSAMGVDADCDRFQPQFGEAPGLDGSLIRMALVLILTENISRRACSGMSQRSGRRKISAPLDPGAPTARTVRRGWDCQEEGLGGGELIEEAGDLGERHLAVIVVIEVAVDAPLVAAAGQIQLSAQEGARPQRQSNGRLFICSFDVRRRGRSTT